MHAGVTFRLRPVHGPAHALFRAEGLLNTPLFAGFPGFTSKLWLAHDEHDRYRGVYEWDGPERAEHYACSLWLVLALVSVPGSIRCAVLPGLRRDDVLADPGLADGLAPDDDATWWRLHALLARPGVHLLLQRDADQPRAAISPAAARKTTTSMAPMAARPLPAALLQASARLPLPGRG